MSINDKSPIGYFLEVDLEHPDELHGFSIPMIFHELQKKLLFLGIHCQNIVKKLLMNMK